MANTWRRRNFLSKIKVNEDQLLEKVDIKEGVSIAFQDLPSKARN